jgi:hypothetical protein
LLCRIPLEKIEKRHMSSSRRTKPKVTDLPSL